MKHTAILLTVVLAFVLAGCNAGGNPAVSVRPLYNADEKSFADARIEGEWVSPDLSDTGTEKEIAQYWKFAHKDDYYMVEMRERGEKDTKKSQDKVDHYRVSLVQLGEKTFFDAELTERHSAEGNITYDDMGPGLISVHLVGRIWVAADYLRVALVDSEWVKTNTPEEFRALYGSTAVIVSPTDALRKFFTQHADEEAVFAKPLYFCRPGADCPMRVADDLRARKPNDPDALRQAAQILSARHQYDKAATLLRHRVELQPQDSDARLQLAMALAWVRDFKGARAELEAASRLSTDTDKVPMQELTGWTYFLEGNYEQTTKTFAGDTTTADAILLSYYSLLRLGKHKQSDALLAKEAAHFSGSLQDQILLLDAQGRVRDISSATSSDDDRATYFYFEGLAAIAKGDNKTARERLQASVEAGDELTSLPAKVELERLEKAK